MNVNRQGLAFIYIERGRPCRCCDPLTTVGPETIYRDERGVPCLYVRSETRPGSDGPEHFLISTRDHNVYEHWVRAVPDEWVCVHDAGGRAEASLAWRIVKALEQQRDACLDALRYACDALPPRVADEVRAIYTDRMKDVELISL